MQTAIADLVVWFAKFMSFLVYK